jgi:hypothetical protein
MNTKRFIASGLIVSAIFFFFPIIVYGLFMRFFELVPPAGFGWTDLVIMIPTTILGGFVFVLIFFLAKGSKLDEVDYSTEFYGFLVLVLLVRLDSGLHLSSAQSLWQQG